MQKGWPYIKDYGDFTNKTKNLTTLLDNTILVAADVVGLYPSIPHESGLRPLRESLYKQANLFLQKIWLRWQSLC